MDTLTDNSAPYPGISLTAPWTEAELREFISTLPLGPGYPAFDA